MDVDLIKQLFIIAYTLILLLFVGTSSLVAYLGFRKLPKEKLVDTCKYTLLYYVVVLGVLTYKVYVLPYGSLNISYMFLGYAIAPLFVTAYVRYSIIQDFMLNHTRLATKGYAIAFYTVLIYIATLL